jgi:hypothetical protein
MAARRCFFLILFLFATHQAWAQNTAGHTFSASPVVGINIPYDFWGTPGLLGIYGARAALVLPWSFRVSAASFYHKAGPDWGVTNEAELQYRIPNSVVEAIIAIGLHSTLFRFQIDRDPDTGACIPSNCRTDSGHYLGLVVGGGFFVPLWPRWPVFAMFRYHSKPTQWVTFETGVSWRF